MAQALNTLMERTLRVDLKTVIHMINGQAPEGHEVLPEADWPGIAWVIMQAEAQGDGREKIAENLGINESDIEDMVAGLMATEDTTLANSLWGVGIVTLKTAATAAGQVLTRTWDQVEALAIEKVAQGIQNLPGNKLDPMQMAQIAAIANKAVRRNQGELGGRGAPGGAQVPGNQPMEIELQSGEVGSITLRFGTKIMEQLQAPERIIDVSANKPTSSPNREMLKLKEIRGAIESADIQAEQEEEAFAKSVMAKVNQIKDRQAAAKEQFKIDEIFNFDSKGED